MKLMRKIRTHGSVTTKSPTMSNEKLAYNINVAQTRTHERFGCGHRTVIFFYIVFSAGKSQGQKMMGELKHSYVILNSTGRMLKMDTKLLKLMARVVGNGDRSTKTATRPFFPHLIPVLTCSAKRPPFQPEMVLILVLNKARGVPTTNNEFNTGRGMVKENLRFMERFYNQPGSMPR